MRYIYPVFWQVCPTSQTGYHYTCPTGQSYFQVFLFLFTSFSCSPAKLKLNWEDFLKCEILTLKQRKFAHKGTYFIISTKEKHDFWVEIKAGLYLYNSGIKYNLPTYDVIAKKPKTMSRALPRSEMLSPSCNRTVWTSPKEESFKRKGYYSD